MRRPVICLLLATFLLLVTLPGLAGGGENRNFTAHLSGGEEVPAADTRATGEAVFQLAEDGESLDYRLNVANIENVTQAHIHLAPRGQNGPVVAWLYPEDQQAPRLIEGRFQGTLAQGTISDDDLVGPLAGADLDDLIAEMRAGNTYVNVHTSQSPGGEIRGQIR